MKKFIMSFFVMFISFLIMGCTTIKDKKTEIYQTSTTSSESTTTRMETTTTITSTTIPSEVEVSQTDYKLLQLIHRLTVCTNYQLILNSHEEVETYNHSYASYNLDTSLLNENYFDTHSIVVISFTWSNAEENFNLNKILIKDDHTLEIAISFQRSNIVPPATTQKVFFIEIDKELLSNYNSIQYNIKELNITY